MNNFGMDSKRVQFCLTRVEKITWYSTAPSVAVHTGPGPGCRSASQGLSTQVIRRVSGNQPLQLILRRIDTLTVVLRQGIRDTVKTSRSNFLYYYFHVTSYLYTVTPHTYIHWTAQFYKGIIRFIAHPRTRIYTLLYDMPNIRPRWK